MEYSLLRTIETPLGYFDPIQSLLQSPYQSIDYINPGLGGLARLYDVYVPIHYTNPPHCSNKIVTDQQGFGSNNVTSDQNQLQINSQFPTENSTIATEIQDFNESSAVQREETARGSKDRETLGIPSGNDIANDKGQEEIDLKNEKKRKLLGEGVFEAFMHPAVKTAKLSIKKDVKNPGTITSLQASSSPKEKKTSLPTSSSLKEKKNNPQSLTLKHKFKVI